MDIRSPAALLTGLVPLLSLAGIAASATARDRSRRWIYGVLGWIGWAATVAVGVFAGLVLVAFSCMGSGQGDGCGDDAALGVLVMGAVALTLPAALAYGLTGRSLSSRDSPSDPRPPR